MKKIFTIIILIITTMSFVRSQSFKYQAVLRDNNGNILTNKNVGLKVSIIQGVTPTTSYSEEFYVSTDEFGTINLGIGTGVVLSGNFLTIDWSKANNQLQLDIDITGGKNYTNLGTSPILSVPLANYAAKSGIGGFPAGMIIAFAGDTSKIPSGWLLCNGKAISRTVYSTLFQTIGVSWGAGDIISTFNLPDLRGQFLRGTDLGTANDPDVASRTLKNSAVLANSKVGSYQNDNFASHNHGGGEHSHALQRLVYANENITYIGCGGYIQTSTTGCYFNATYPNTNSSGTIITSQGGNETRSKNAYVNYIIKY
jgi:microcystin-dependent protein